MAYTYILRSQKKPWSYIGSTMDLRQRLGQHNRGEVRSTQFYRPLKLVYYEAYPNYHLARKREVELKAKNQQKEMLFRRLGLYQEK